MSSPTAPDFSDGKPELQRYETAGSIVMPKEIFEKLYLNPEQKVAGQLRKTFGNPTPLGLAGFLLGLSPICVSFMGWRGAAGDGAATIGATYFMGGLLAILAAVGEFFLGNSFSMMLFGVYGGFFLTYGATQQPSFNAYLAFDPSDPTAAVTSTPFLACLGFFTLCMALFTFMMFICSLRTNIAFAGAFLSLFFAYVMFTVSEWMGAQGNMAEFHHYRVITGGFLFVTISLGWYLLFSMLLAIVDFPFQLPVGDLSGLVKGYSETHRPQSVDEMA